MAAVRESDVGGAILNMGAYVVRFHSYWGAGARRLAPLRFAAVSAAILHAQRAAQSRKALAAGGGRVQGQGLH